MSLQRAAALVPLLPYQRQAVDRDCRFTWNCWARQTGKSFTFSLRRLLHGLARRRNQIILSAGERQSREVMDKVRRHCQTLGLWCEWHGYRFFRGTALRQLEVRLPGGVRIIGLPANPMTARGFTGDVFLDEFAMHGDDEAIWSALFPSLLRGSGELDVASTPLGQRNTFFRLRENARFHHETVPLSRAVGEGLEVDVDALREALGDETAWRQEFCCEFVDEATSFLTYDLIHSCQDVRLDVALDWPRLDRPRVEMYLGVDFGRVRDLTVLWLWERVGETFFTRGVMVLAAAPFVEQEEVIAGLLQRRSVQRCAVDATGLGAPLAERLQHRFGTLRVDGVVFTTARRNLLAGGLRLRAERGELRIPPDEAIVRDWHALARQPAVGGHARLVADRSAAGHADRFWAAALGLHAAGDAPGGMEWITAERPAFARSGVW